MQAKNEKGQVTLFVILGIVIVVITFFMLYILVSTIESDLDAEQRDILAEFVDMDQIDFYFQSCIDETLDEVLYNLSKQGGILYEDQGGLQERTSIDTLQHDGIDISYGLRFEDLCSIAFESPPDYPLPQTNISDIPSIYEDNTAFSDEGNACDNAWLYHSGFFGRHVMPRMCFLAGPNLGAGNQFIDITPCSENVDIARQRTLEANINAIIENKSFSCIDDQPFQDSEGESIEPIMDEARTRVIFTPDSFLLDIEVPFLINVEDEQLRVNYVFDYAPGTDFINLYRYAFELVRNTAKNALFSIENDYVGVENYRGSYDVSVHRKDLSAGENDFVIEIHDTSEDLRFWTAISGRPPALDYIRKTPSEKPYDIIILENETYEYHPMAYDPDGLRIGYTYEGWKQTSHTRFRFDICDEPILLEDLEDELINNNCMQNIVSGFSLQDSQLYQDTNKNASVNLTSDDAGLHTTRIIAQDEGGLFDYQDVSVAVVDLPLADFSIDKTYDSAFYNLEAPLQINATTSRPSIITGKELLDYNMTITTPSEQFNVITPDNIFLLDNEDINIQNIREVMKEILLEGSTFNMTVTGSANLTGDKVLRSKPETQNFGPINPFNKVYCISNSNPSNNNYPYNSSNAYLANTPCCISNEVVAEEICYEETFSPSDFHSLDVELDILKNDLLNEYYDIYGVDVDDIVDDYSGIDTTPGSGFITVRRFCDGNRGNICAGRVEFDQ